MKTLTNESKARFFAQYLGTGYIAIETKKPTDASVRVENVLCCQYTSNYHLQLTPLQNISDEHAIEVARIFKARGDSFNEKYIRETIFKIVDKKHLYSVIDSYDFHNALEYLRYKGYAMPYFCPIENRIIPVQEQIDNGWITLKTE